MHRLFKDNLATAVGQSKFVIVVNVDVRGFSAFSKVVDSAESALFIKKVFMKMLSRYFMDASFLKSTGDGLIIIYDIVEESLKEKTEAIVSSCIELVADFGGLCNDEPMVNFPVPQRCGIGIARGPATCMSTKDLVLDYTGDTLNIASRLMEIARPEGVVFPESIGPSLLSDELKSLFIKSDVYLKGIAESAPISVFHQNNVVALDTHLTKPIFGETWHTQDQNFKLAEILEIDNVFIFILDHSPVSEKSISVQATHMSVNNGRINKKVNSYYNLSDFLLSQRGKQWQLEIDFQKLYAKLVEIHAFPSIDVTISITYSI